MGAVTSPTPYGEWKNMKMRSSARGIDTTRQLTAMATEELQRDSFEFVIRYLSRAAFNNLSDIRATEAETILSRGMALGFCQHCPPTPWQPNELIARADGIRAVKQLRDVGAPYGVTVWFDLESVDAINTSPAALKRHLNAWTEIVEGSGFQAGVYVGSDCFLGPIDLFYGLKARRYWSAYNLDLDRYPAVRSVCMHQHSNTAQRPWADINVVSTDALGGLPAFWEPNT